MTQVLCITGASGFIGGRALERVAQMPGTKVRALAHRRPVPPTARVEIVHGDAADAVALEQLLEPGAVVLNFAYGRENAGESLAEALGLACVRRRVRRLVHISTCSVYGSVPGELIDEETACLPVTAYERAKRAIEGILERHSQDKYELVLLRPTAVFGPGGRNLESLARRVLREPWLRRFLRACAMGRRHMHAVDVECVAAAAVFLASAPLHAAAERFIVSQDDEPMNDYQSIEEFFVRRFRAAPYPIAPLGLPTAALRIALRLAGRSNVEPRRRYSSAKLAARGFARPRPFNAALEEYADWIGQHAHP